jgi:hypothetical protein
MIVVPVVPMNTLQEVSELASKSYWSGTGSVRVTCHYCGQFQQASGERLSVYHDFQCVTCGATNDHICIVPDAAKVVPCGLMNILLYHN